ncbi:hypothetical protein CANCADRAFT_56867 [Tortispora caseinolytica NRRL Y-17796]|uniref:Uncharacterized protein n=1 Tax=Tortispora caseinolytica NRRL Y-17796 TaxID=767744 RepID=A0A1E4TEY0_9ASCO|nr:hypothetical protein CANCADRAFT_56867 [Tortispora caseinolytica NRRL Y-17796]
MSTHQEYIARIRYSNALPPPPSAPALRDIPVTIDSFLEPSFVTPLVGKTVPNVDIDSELGMPLNLLNIPAALNEDMSSLGPAEGVTLHPDDQALLVDVASFKAQRPSSGKPQPQVAFLRRTEYISSEAVKQRAELNAGKTGSQWDTQDAEKFADPEQQAKLIDEMFVSANSSISDGALKHPKKKHLVAQEVYPMLPDVNALDLEYIIIKPAHSANEKENDPAIMSTDLYRPYSIGKEECVSRFHTAKENVEELREEKKSSTPAHTDKVFRFTHERDYIMDYKRNGEAISELITYIDTDSKVARYVPITGRVYLKRQRTNPRYAAAQKNNHVSVIELSLHEVDDFEKAVRNNAKHEFDPETYPYTEISEEQEANDNEAKEVSLDGDLEEEAVADEATHEATHQAIEVDNDE